MTISIDTESVWWCLTQLHDKSSQNLAKDGTYLSLIMAIYDKLIVNNIVNYDKLKAKL